MFNVLFQLFCSNYSDFFHQITHIQYALCSISHIQNHTVYTYVSLLSLGVSLRFIHTSAVQYTTLKALAPKLSLGFPKGPQQSVTKICLLPSNKKDVKTSSLLCRYSVFLKECNTIKLCQVKRSLASFTFSGQYSYLHRDQWQSPHFYQDKIRQTQCATQATTQMSYLRIPLNQMWQRHYYKTRTVVHVWNQCSGNCSGNLFCGMQGPSLTYSIKKVTS